MQKLRFEPHLIPTLATLCGVALFVNLGLWQAGKAERRAAEVEQHGARARLGPFAIGGQPVDPVQLQDAPVTVRGLYETRLQFFVDNRQEDGQPGVHVVTPLKIAGSETRILINRGWVGWGQSRSALPPISTPDTLVEVTGVAAVPVNKPFFLMPNSPEQLPRLWSRLDVERFAKEAPFAVQPVVVLQTGAGHGDSLVRKWPPPEDRVARHQSYAYQWFGMAFALLIFYGFASVRPEKRE
jgi:surfeit locus 1 family protein